MSIERVLQSLIQVLEFLGSSKREDFVSFSMNNDIDRDSFKWGVLGQRCSFVHVSYITRPVIREKNFRSDPFVKE